MEGPAIAISGLTVRGIDACLVEVYSLCVLYPVWRHHGQRCAGFNDSFCAIVYVR
jgi:hypothetical protein